MNASININRPVALDRTSQDNASNTTCDFDTSEGLYHDAKDIMNTHEILERESNTRNDPATEKNSK